jgi:hypothetical protein
MGYNVSRPWHPWVYADEYNTTQIGGYSIKYDVSLQGKGIILQYINMNHLIFILYRII